MNKTNCFAMLAAGVFLGLIGVDLVGGQDSPQPVTPAAQQPATPRYQVSAYAASKYQGVNHGCYVVDTMTGELWHARQGGQPDKIVSEWPAK